MRFKMKAFALLFALLAPLPAAAQGVYPGMPVAPLWYCSLSAAQLAVATPLSACVSSSFTGTGSGTNLTTSAVTGAIKPGMTVAGTGVPAGTTIVSQTSGTPAGAGVYVTSQPTTSAGAALTGGGIPPNANAAILEADTANIRFRDDGGAPTSTLGLFLVGSAGNTIQAQFFYTGTLSNLQFILASGTPTLHVSFYRFYTL